MASPLRTWLVRSAAGSNTNGGSSSSILASALDGVTSNGANFTSVSGLFTASMVGHGIWMSISGTDNYYIVSSLTSPTAIVLANPDGTVPFLGARTGVPWTVGGAWANLSLPIGGTGTPVQAGDSIYIGAGTYRTGSLAFTISGTAGNPIRYIGDVDGAKTGDSGEVTVSSYSSGDKSTPSASVLIALGLRHDFSFSFITFIGGTGQLLTSQSTVGINITFTDCTLNAIASTGTLITPTTMSTTLNWLFDRCIFIARGTIYSSTLLSVAGGTDWDANVLFRNCYLLSIGGNGITVISSGGNSGRGGGVRVQHSTIIAGQGIGLNLSGTFLSPLIPCEIHNSVVIANSTALQNASIGTLVESFNALYAGTLRSANVGVGKGSNTSDSQIAPAFDFGQASKWAGAQVGLTRPFMGPSASASVLLGYGASSAAIGAGSAGASGVTVDFLNRPRPAGGAAAGASAHSAGFMEFHDFAQRDAVVFNDSPAAAALYGPGDQYIQIPVDGTASATVSIFMRFDSYGGTTYPTATLLANGELGTPAQTLTMSPSSSTWQQLIFNVVFPSKNGWVTVQIQSFDNVGTGVVRFDTLAVA